MKMLALSSRDSFSQTSAHTFLTCPTALPRPYTTLPWRRYSLGSSLSKSKWVLCLHSYFFCTFCTLTFPRLYEMSLNSSGLINFNILTPIIFTGSLYSSAPSDHLRKGGRLEKRCTGFSWNPSRNGTEVSSGYKHVYVL